MKQLFIFPLNLNHISEEPRKSYLFTQMHVLY